MISVVIWSVFAVLLVGLVTLRARYGSLRVSEFPVLLWCLLAGGGSRRQLRAILVRREQRRPSLLPKVRVSCDDYGVNFYWSQDRTCRRCGMPNPRHAGMCLTCCKAVRTTRYEEIRAVGASLKEAIAKEEEAKAKAEDAAIRVRAAVDALYVGGFVRQPQATEEEQ